MEGKSAVLSSADGVNFYNTLQQWAQIAAEIDLGIFDGEGAPVLLPMFAPDQLNGLLSHALTEGKFTMFETIPRCVVLPLGNGVGSLVLSDLRGDNSFFEKAPMISAMLANLVLQWNDQIRYLHREKETHENLEKIVAEHVLRSSLHELFSQEGTLEELLPQALEQICIALQARWAKLDMTKLAMGLSTQWGQEEHLTDQEKEQMVTQNIRRGNQSLGSIQLCGQATSHKEKDSLKQQLGVVASIIATESTRKAKEISMRMQMDDVINQVSTMDNNVGLPNRARFERDLSSCLQEREAIGCVIMLDIDRFRSVNECFGHEVGDQLLRQIAQFLTSLPGMEDCVYFFGSDQYLLLLHDYTYQRANAVIARIRRRFRSNWEVSSNSQFCTVSGGIVTYPADGNTSSVLLRKVDVALKAAKNRGGNTFTPFVESRESMNDNRFQIENALKRAVMTDCPEFEVYYQPLVDVQGRILSAEALLRWKSTELGGMISPVDFIPVAEYLGLIGKLGEHVLRTACSLCAQWHRLGKENMNISVNLSINQLYDANFVGHVQAILGATRLPAKNLVLEVTESMAITDGELMNERLSQLRDLGIRIALDDFGTGYSSINCLRSLPLDVIKIDRSFVRDMMTDAYYRDFVRSIIDLSHSAGHRVCCEGIEGKDQHEVLIGLSCDLMQGYYFGRPMPGDQFTRLLFS